MKHKIRFLILLILLLLAAYFSLVCLPYLSQGGVTEDTRAQFQKEAFYGESPGQDRAMILFENQEALEERLRLIANAKERVILSTFDFMADNSGKIMLAALYDAAQRGVKIQVLVDGFPYFAHMMGRPHFQALGSHPNATIKVYNPVNPLKPHQLMARLHDKYLIADQTAYILGGRNTYDFFLGDQTSYVNYDWDFLVYNTKKDENSSLKQVEDYFTSIWNLEDSRVKMEAPGFLSLSKTNEAAKELKDIYKTLQREHPDWLEPADYETRTVPTNQIRLISNPIEPERKEPVAFYEMTELMAQSQEPITFHTPYILCNDYMLERLSNICEKNPQVRMMTNSVANNGNPFGASDYALHKGEILETGIKILEYDSGVSYHGKCFSIGDRLSAIGSFNWDMRSAYLDTELMLVIDSRELSAQMRQKMTEYEEDSLFVLTEDTYDLKEGQTPSELSQKNRRRLSILRPFQFLRYLM